MGQDTKVKTTVEFSSSQYEWLVNTADRSDTSVSNLLKSAIAALQVYREIVSDGEHDVICERRPGSLNIPVGTSIADAERALVMKTMDYCNWQQKSAAKFLGVCDRTIRNKLRSYNTNG